MTKNSSKILKFIFAFLLFAPIMSAMAFKVNDIRVEGLRRIRNDTVMSYVKIRPGQELSAKQSRSLVNKLYRTQFFNDVRLIQHGDTLIIRVVERSVIGALRVRGNKMIKTDEIKKVLKENGVSEGEVYNPSKVSSIKVGLETQYFNQGRYNAEVKVNIEDKGEGRVGVTIDIYEGQTAKIKKITIVGNRAFDESCLLRQFNLTKSRTWSPLFSNDQYSREKLNADLEILRSYYMDRGYINFVIEAVQVSITPDKKQVYITINVNEGPVFVLKQVNIEGEVNGNDKVALRKLLTLKSGRPFSRKDIIDSTKQMNSYYQDKGFAYAKIDVRPQINEQERSIDINYKISPGLRVYVRRVSFEGNTRTKDEVFRREIRQFEGALYSESQIKLSKRKIDNLGFVEKTEINKQPVPGSPDQIDIVYKFKETSTASARAQVGYSDAVGFVFGAGINQKNFLGSGRAVGINFEKNDAFRTVNLSYFNPYATISGIGHGYNLFYNKTTPGKVGTANYTTDAYGLSMSLTFPISEFNLISLSGGYTRLNFKIDQAKASKELVVFTRTNGEKCDPTGYPNSYFIPPYDNETQFDEFTTSLGWHDSNYDRAIYPTSGYSHSLVLTTTLPITSESMTFYKVSYTGSYYFPLSSDFIFHTTGRLAYGDGYGRIECLPFFQNYHAGGMDTVRGLEDNSLGPRDSRGKSLGGNILTAASAELIFPNPLGEKIRTRFYVDAGNVFENEFDFNEIRLSGGLQVDWISPFGPLRFSLGYPLIKFGGDRKQIFSFSIGTSL